MSRHLITAVTALLFTVTAAVASVACRQNGAASQPTIARIRHNGVLLVGTTGDYHPLTYLEPDGSYSGFDIEIAEEIAKEIGVAARFVPTSWPTLSSDVTDEPQKFDFAVGGITITERRLEAMQMSEGYLANGKTVNRVIRRMKTDGSLEELHKKYGLVLVRDKE